MTPTAERSVVALVPMRHHSLRVEGKNYRPIVGRPLYAYILDTLLGCELVSKIVVDTDSSVIREGIRQAFPSVDIIPRPDNLTGDDVPMNEILIHDLKQVPSAFYLQTHSTNPLLKGETIFRAINTFFDGQPDHDSLFSVTPFRTRLWTTRGDPVNHDPNQLIPTQDLEPLLVENSCLYIFSQAVLLERRNRIGHNPILFEIEDEEAVDIDTEWEFSLAEYLIGRRQTEA